MRNFINIIFAFIGAESLNDEEFDMIDVTAQSLTLELYKELLIVLDSRETVSTTRQRLTAYFVAAGVDVGQTPSAARSNIFLGSGL